MTIRLYRDCGDGVQMLGVRLGASVATFSLNWRLLVGAPPVWWHRSSEYITWGLGPIFCVYRRLIPGLLWSDGVAIQ